MLKRTLLTALAASTMLAFAASAQAAYLSLGTTNTSNATTTLTGTPAGAELWVKNTNGASAGAFGLYGLLTATAPSANAAAVRGHSSSTNGYGMGVYGSQSGSGTGVRGFAPSGKGVWGSSTSGIGVLAEHTATTGSNPALSASTNSTAANATALKATINGPGWGIYGQDLSNGSTGVGVFGFHNGSGAGVQGMAVSGRGVAGFSGSWQGVYGHSNSNAGVVGESTGLDGVWGQAHKSTTAGVSGHNDAGGWAVWGGTTGEGTAIYGTNSGVAGNGVEGFEPASEGFGVFGHGSIGGGFSGTTYAGFFTGNVRILNGTCTGCTGPNALQIDDPLDPAHRYLQHSSVTSSQQLDVYSGNVTTDGRGFATVTMPRWFEALNRSFRYQLTVIDRAHWTAKAAVWHKIAHNRFTIRTDQAHVQISWQVTAVRHDRYANAHPTQVIAPKAEKDQGKYVHPELYGKPKSDGIGYRKPPAAPKKPLVKR